jgi:hypothetical protein
MRTYIPISTNYVLHLRFLGASPRGKFAFITSMARDYVDLVQRINYVDTWN